MSVPTLIPAQVVGAALSTPVMSLIVAIPLTLVVAAFVRPSVRRADDLTDSAFLVRYRRESLALRMVAIALIVVFAVESVLRGYVIGATGILDEWRFAGSMVVALFGLLLVAMLVLAHGRAAPEAPLAALTRREWWSFSTLGALTGVALVAVLTMMTVVSAGLASSPDGRGRYVMVWIPVPNTTVDPIGLRFFGWAYGVPVLIALIALLGVFWMLLRANSLRAFRRPATAAAESTARRRIAADAARIVMAGVLLSLAGAWRLIAGTGTSSTLSISGDPQTYDFTWRFAELARAVGWLAPVLEIGAFVLLLLLVFGPRRHLAGSDSESPRRALAMQGDSV